MSSTNNINSDLSPYAKKSDLLPVGSYIQFAGSQAPTGFLVCNGGAVSRTTYAKLFAVIGTTYGSGDGSTTFNLPNLTDRFLQGSTSAGTIKEAGLPNITGDAAPCLPSGDTVSNIVPLRWYDGALKPERNHEYEGSYGIIKQSPAAIQKYWGGIGLDASLSSSIYGNSATVQPPALTCLICIKY